MKRLVILMATVALAAVGVSAADVAPFEWTPPESWTLPVWRGSDFHFVGREGYLRSVPDHPAFQDFIVVYRREPVKLADGSIEFPLESYEDSFFAKEKDGSLRPFMLTFAARANLRPYVILWAQVRHDRARYEKWLAAHPTYLGTFSGEWVNDATLPYTCNLTDASKKLPQHKDWVITPEQKAAVLARDEFVHGKDNRFQFTTNLLRTCYRRLEDVYLRDGSRFMCGDGMSLSDHLLGDWGCGILSVETSRNGCLWQRQIMSTRGAAREFGGLPWRWYLASYFRGFDSKGRWCTEGYLNAAHPEHGPSVSALKRGTYLTYLAGSSFYEREDAGGALWHGKDLTLSPEGEMFVAFRDFIARVPDRGIPYQPVAILMSRFRGYIRTGGKAWRWLPYEHSDRHLDVVFSTILEGEKNSSRSALKKGRERVMANSRYGDLFDLLVADCERQDCFRKSLMDYKAAVLTGAYAPNPEMEATLKAYVEQGGTLVVNVAQLTDGLAWAKGGKVVRADEKGAPVYSEKALGRGRVILSHIPYAAPWSGNDDESVRRMLAETTDSGDPIRFPHVEWLFDRLMPSLTPAKVTGDIQYGFNRTKDGWILYLVNNGGVTKFGDKLPEYDPKGTEVTVDFSRLPHASVRELVANRPFALEGETLKITIPSGDLAALELK